MCLECGCGVNQYAPKTRRASAQQASPAPETTVAAAPTTDQSVLAMHTSLMSDNDRVATSVRSRLARHQVLAVNLMSSPGTGKTALLQALIPLLAPRHRCAVVVGDLETDNDAQRIRQTGAPAIQITTGQACHLDATMVSTALDRLDLANLDILFIENVGNLVCPATFDLGEAHRIALLSVCEGDDKPAKYPTLFHKADLMLITKADLLPLLPQFSPERAQACLRDLANSAPCLMLSSVQADSLQPLVEWFDRARDAARSAAAKPRWTPA